MMILSTTPESLDDILSGIVPSIPEFLTALISLGILLIVVTALVYKPIKKSIEDRKSYVAKNIEESENRLKSSQVKLDEAKENLASSKNVGKNIVTTSVREANEKSNKILVDAKDKSHQIIDEARNQALSEINTGRQQIKNESIDIAISISEKLIDKKIDKAKDSELIEAFLKEMDNDIR